MVWRGENVGIGNKAQNPSTLLHLYSDSSSSAELRITAGSSDTNSDADPSIRFTGQNDGTSEGFLMRYDNSVGDFYFDQVWTGLANNVPAMRFRVETDGTPIEGMHLRADGGLVVNEVLRAEKLIQSNVAQGSPPFQVASNTVVTNLNADLLDGYSALNLPHLGASVNQWLSDDGGQERFYFSNNSHTYLRTGDNFYFRSNNNTGMGSIDGDGGYWTIYGGGDQTQSSYRMEIRGANGLNINTSSVGLSSGQRSVVLRADGDKQWIDRYGVIKRNRNSIGESTSINSGDNCLSSGPVTINNGVTVTINSGGYWSIV